jgi:Dyp-type peroxidase family
LIIELNEDQKQSRVWLGSIASEITYGMSYRPDAVVVAFTASGLSAKLGLTDGEMASFPTAFQSGMVSLGRSRALGDTGPNDPKEWTWGGPGKACDAMLALYAQSEEALSDLIGKHVRKLKDAGCNVMPQINLQPRPDRCSTEQKYSTEPFGFRDGVSQPLLRGTVRAIRQPESPHIVAPGEFVLGYNSNSGHRRISPRVLKSRDPAGILAIVKGEHGVGYGDLGRNGTFFVVRQLEQDVDAFDHACCEAAGALEKQGVIPLGLPAEEMRAFAAAKMMGRWQDGSSLVRHPKGPGREADNDFLYGAEDPSGQACPLGAHIRRANPRDSLLPGATDPLTISNSHRLLRVGRPYSDEKAGKKGILFMCLNSDIELQFEVVQQTWLMRTDFHGLRNEVDPIIGSKTGARVYTIPAFDGAVQLTGLANFVTVKGGAYFFMPSRAAMRFLGSLPDSKTPRRPSKS